MDSRFITKAKYQIKIDENYSQCLTCERRCKIERGKTGFCNTRINKDGEIFTLVYGLIPAISFNPIEKKPLYHFHPGSIALTVGTYGCNFSCFWCQNFHLSKTKAIKVSHLASSDELLTPSRLIKIALQKGCQGTSISFNEPTLLFEYSVEVFKLAKKSGMYNTYITNGYMTEEVLRDLVDAGLDAMNIDIKGDSEMVHKYCGASVEKVWNIAKLARELGIHIEITTLLIQDLNAKDDIISKIAKRIFEELGELTPFHISRFFPLYESEEHGLNDATPLELLLNAYNLAKSIGLKYVYLGNLPVSDYENTYCPKCSRLVIKREGLRIAEKKLDFAGNCQFCGFPICIL
ncbi:MAG: AmmeMemoRadiSam system radical SAM enzyme [Promethearchaeota archaeon]